MSEYHVPVLLNEVVQALAPKSGQRHIDGTLGGAGHAQALLQAGSPDSLLLGIDRDEEAITQAANRLASEQNRITLVHGNYQQMVQIAHSNGMHEVDGILLDLGLSSHQIDDASRGFSYMQDAILDMRQDRGQALTAQTVVNTYDKAALTRIISVYGEERWASRIASFIVETRQKAPITTTGQLVALIDAAIPQAARRGGKHPARRTFQAIRIEVNNEIIPLEKAFNDAFTLLKKGGRLAIISFHALEHRAVKSVFNTLVDPCTCPKGAPICFCGKVPQAKWIVRKATGARQETEENSRAKSAQLRVIERI